jgi:hypothetical protein
MGQFQVGVARVVLETTVGVVVCDVTTFSGNSTSRGRRMMLRLQHVLPWCWLWGTVEATLAWPQGDVLHCPCWTLCWQHDNTGITPIS